MRLKKVKYVVAAWWALLLGSGALWAVPARAAGLSFTPAFLQIDIPAGENIQYASVAIKNDNPVTAALKAKPTDVDTSDSALRPLTTSTSLATKAISLAQESFTLAANQDLNLNVKIDGTNLPPGGHYSSIVIKQVVGVSQKSVPITQAVSVGVFIVKEEGAQRLLNLTSALPSGIMLHKLENLTLRMQAGGNVAVTPRASVSIYEGEELLAKSTINDGSANLQPGASKDFKVSFMYQKALSPGRHKVIVSYRYDGQTVPLTKEAVFWYIPWWYFVFLIIGIAVLLKFGHFLRPHHEESVKEMPVVESVEILQEIPLETSVDIPVETPVTAVESEKLPAKKPRPKATKSSSTKPRKKSQKKPIQKS